MKRTKALESTAHHEAGHAFDKFRFDMKMTRVRIVPDLDTNTSGHVLFKPGFTSRDADKINWGIICHLAETPPQQQKMTGGGVCSAILEAYKLSVEKSRGKSLPNPFNTK